MCKQLSSESLRLWSLLYVPNESMWQVSKVTLAGTCPPRVTRESTSPLYHVQLETMKAAFTNTQTHSHTHHTFNNISFVDSCVCSMSVIQWLTSSSRPEERLTQGSSRSWIFNLPPSMREHPSSLALRKTWMTTSRYANSSRKSESEHNILCSQRMNRSQFCQC